MQESKCKINIKRKYEYNTRSNNQKIYKLSKVDSNKYRQYSR